MYVHYSLTWAETIPSVLELLEHLSFKLPHFTCPISPLIINHIISDTFILSTSDIKRCLKHVISPTNPGCYAELYFGVVKPKCWNEICKNHIMSLLWFSSGCHSCRWGGGRRQPSNAGKNRSVSWKFKVICLNWEKTSNI